MLVNIIYTCVILWWKNLIKFLGSKNGLKFLCAQKHNKLHFICEKFYQSKMEDKDWNFGKTVLSIKGSVKIWFQF